MKIKIGSMNSNRSFKMRGNEKNAATINSKPTDRQLETAESYSYASPWIKPPKRICAQVWKRRVEWQARQQCNPVKWSEIPSRRLPANIWGRNEWTRVEMHKNWMCLRVNTYEKPRPTLTNVCMSIYTCN